MQIKELVNSFRNRDDPDEMVFEDGSAYVKRYENVRLGPLDTGLAGRQRWFSVAEEDTDLLVLKAALGGWFGLGGKGSAVPEWLAEVFRLMTDSFSRKGGW